MNTPSWFRKPSQHGVSFHCIKPRRKVRGGPVAVYVVFSRCDALCGLALNGDGGGWTALLVNGESRTFETRGEALEWLRDQEVAMTEAFVEAQRR